MSDSGERGLWLALRRHTQARIGLGRAGDSLPMDAVLEFGLAHAQARDAVHMALDVPGLQKQLTQAGFTSSIVAHSAARDRLEYLRRPDRGRQLSEESRQQLSSRTGAAGRELAIVIADGLSALAVMRHAVPLLQALQPQLARQSLAPIVIAQQGRVALGDEIGQLWRAEQVIVLIGERPGLSSADSLGIYLTFAPQTGRTDAERNCISNVRSEGLGYEDAARRLTHLILAARRLGRSGVDLKDDSDSQRLDAMRVQRCDHQPDQTQSEEH